MSEDNEQYDPEADLFESGTEYNLQDTRFTQLNLEEEFDLSELNLNELNQIKKDYKVIAKEVTCEQLREQISELKENYDKQQNEIDYKNIQIKGQKEKETVLQIAINKARESLVNKRKMIDNLKYVQEKKKNEDLIFREKMASVIAYHEKNYKEMKQIYEKLPLAKQLRQKERKICIIKVELAIIRKEIEDQKLKNKTILEIRKRKKQQHIIKFAEAMVRYNKTLKLKTELDECKENICSLNKEIEELTQNIAYKKEIRGQESPDINTRAPQTTNYFDLPVTCLDINILKNKSDVLNISTPLSKPKSQPVPLKYSLLEFLKKPVSQPNPVTKQLRKQDLNDEIIAKFKSVNSPLRQLEESEPRDILSTLTEETESASILDDFSVAPVVVMETTNFCQPVVNCQPVTDTQSELVCPSTNTVNGNTEMEITNQPPVLDIDVENDSETTSQSKKIELIKPDGMVLSQNKRKLSNISTHDTSREKINEEDLDLISCSRKKYVKLDDGTEDLLNESSHTGYTQAIQEIKLDDFSQVNETLQENIITISKEILDVELVESHSNIVENISSFEEPNETKSPYFEESAPVCEATIPATNCVHDHIHEDPRNVPREQNQTIPFDYSIENNDSTSNEDNISLFSLPMTNLSPNTAQYYKDMNINMDASTSDVTNARSFMLSPEGTSYANLSNFVISPESMNNSGNSNVLSLEPNHTNNIQTNSSSLFNIFGSKPKSTNNEESFKFSFGSTTKNSKASTFFNMF